MVMVGISSGPTDQPTEMMESADSASTAAGKSKLNEPSDVMLKELADMELAERMDCDSIFGEPDPNLAVSRPVTYVTQSRFFTPLFNAAIFDGPIRIYFAQHQESQAMKLYFNLQGRYADLRKQARDVFRERGANIFVMLYPDAATFEASFGTDFDDVKGDTTPLGHGMGAEAGAKSAPSACIKTAIGDSKSQTIGSERMGSDYVLGVRGPVQDESFEALCQKMETIIRHQ